MIRTQVYLTEEQAIDIKARALREKRREADVIRDLLNRGRSIGQGKKNENVRDTLLRLGTLGLHGPTDLSTKHNDYLYGEK